MHDFLSVFHSNWDVRKILCKTLTSKILVTNRECYHISV